MLKFISIEKNKTKGLPDKFRDIIFNYFLEKYVDKNKYNDNFKNKKTKLFCLLL